MHIKKKITIENSIEAGTKSLRYYAYGDINKKTNEPDLYLFDFIIDKGDRLIGIRTSKFIINYRSVSHQKQWGFIE